MYINNYKENHKMYTNNLYTYRMSSNISFHKCIFSRKYKILIFVNYFRSLINKYLTIYI